MLQGLFGYTSLIHYDVERSFGVVPAPMVTFAMGYPVLISAISLFGVSLQSAAWIVSATSTVACVPVLAWIARRMGLTRVFCNAVIGCFVINGAVVEFGGSALSEAPFALCLLLGTALACPCRRRYRIAKHGSAGSRQAARLQRPIPFATQACSSSWLWRS